MRVTDRPSCRQSHLTALRQALSYSAMSRLHDMGPSTSNRCSGVPDRTVSRQVGLGFRPAPRGPAGPSPQHPTHAARDVTVRAKSHEFSLWRENLPVPKDWSPGVVPGARTTATPLLSPELVRRHNASSSAVIPVCILGRARDSKGTVRSRKVTTRASRCAVVSGALRSGEARSRTAPCNSVLERHST